ncbi:MAG: hypothetical protein HKN82_12535 [Akkermansiaceae bacterium]|nr:hypothetical protein [Akkermansiaceae bacterium]NNM29872.1 hypothetical protein [Akkermansiaceae bacterium]
MVGLARKHKDDSLHVIASHCQMGKKEPTLAYLKSEGWDEEMANVTVMSQTRYPDEVKVTHVPYYLIFDHTGKLRYHHMAGPWHGGNGDKYRELVAELLAEVPREEKRDADGPLTGMRGWTNAEGKEIEAALLGVKDGTAQFRMRNGKVYEYKLERLSAASREEIEGLRDATE